MVEFETYYGSAPHKPLWVRSFHDEMAKMKLKKLPMADTNLHEQFRKYFGYKKALKYKVGSCGFKKKKSFIFVCFISFCLLVCMGFGEEIKTLLLGRNLHWVNVLM